MQIVLAAVGRAKPGPERVLFDHYKARLAWPFTLREVEEKRPLPTTERLTREGDLLLGAAAPGGILVVLDERGKSLTSESFAERMASWRDQAYPAVSFLIGGADGHGPVLRAKADLLLSLGEMTWPHMLVRGMIMEQLFRAECILTNHPYHRGRIN